MKKFKKILKWTGIFFIKPYRHFRGARLYASE